MTIAQNTVAMQGLRALVDERRIAADADAQAKAAEERRREAEFLTWMQRQVHQVLLDDFGLPYDEDITIERDADYWPALFTITVEGWPRVVLASLAIAGRDINGSPETANVSLLADDRREMTTPEALLAYFEETT